MYNQVTPKDVAEIVREHLELGRPVRRLIEDPNEPAPGASASDSAKQTTSEKSGDT
jgi:hypothetical protein